MDGWRLNDNIFERPELAIVIKAFIRRPGFNNNFNGFFIAREAFFLRNTKAIEFNIAVAFTDPEIEAAAGGVIRFLADPSRKPNGVSVDTESGTLDCDLDTQIDVLAQRMGVSVPASSA